MASFQPLTMLQLLQAWLPAFLIESWSLEEGFLERDRLPKRGRVNMKALRRMNIGVAAI